MHQLRSQYLLCVRQLNCKQLLETIAQVRLNSEHIHTELVHGSTNFAAMHTGDTIVETAGTTHT